MKVCSQLDSRTDFKGDSVSTVNQDLRDCFSHYSKRLLQNGSALTRDLLTNYYCSRYR